MHNHKTMKAAFDRIARSGFHRLMTPVLPLRRKPEAVLDLVGTLFVISLSVTLVSMVRLILAN